MPLLAVDPGRSTGVACFSDQKLVAVWRVADMIGTCSLVGAVDGSSEAVIEKPRIYRAALMKGDPNDIITLAIRVGRYQEYLEAGGWNVALVTPQEWKGQTPKLVHHARTIKALTEEEGQVIQKAGLVGQSDVMDAIGLGLWKLGRLRR